MNGIMPRKRQRPLMKRYGPLWRKHSSAPSISSRNGARFSIARPNVSLKRKRWRKQSSLNWSIIRSLDRHKPLPNRAAQSRTYGAWFFMRGTLVNGDPKPAELSRPPERPPPELGNRWEPLTVERRSGCAQGRHLDLVDETASGTFETCRPFR